MLNAALPVFLLMSGAAALGYLLAWLWSRQQMKKHIEQIPQLKNQLAEVHKEVDRLLEYTNGFHMEKKELLDENETLQQQIAELKATHDQLGKDKAFLLEEFNRLSNVPQNQLVEEIFMDNPSDDEAFAEPATDDTQLARQVLEKQLMDVQNELAQWKSKYEVVKNSMDKKTKKATDIEELTIQETAKVKSKKWESKYKKLKLKLVAITKERDKVLSQIDALKVANDQLLTELLEAKAIKNDGIDRLLQRKQLLNLDRIGQFNGTKKDDLKKISGVGPFIEKKLNALGIYKFEQLANLTDDDLKEIIKVIELPSGIVRGANWVEQARNLNGEED